MAALLMTPADKRARSLIINPRKPQKNNWRHFQVAKKTSDIDLVIGERIARIKDAFTR